MLLYGDSAKWLKQFDFNCINLTVTSPPYDNLRSYDNNSKFDFKTIAKELYRVTKHGGVLVWVVGDETENFNESLTSFRQALYFQEVGWKLHDTMIYRKNGISMPSDLHRRYQACWEYMFVFCKNYVKTFNPIRDKKTIDDSHYLRKRHKRDPKTGNVVYSDIFDYSEKKKSHFALRDNIWTYQNGYLKATKDVMAYNHPAIFPEQLVQDHILSWSKEGNYVLDPFCGSGTTYKMALKLGRIPIGIESNMKYIKIAKSRLRRYLNQKKEFGVIFD